MSDMPKEIWVSDNHLEYPRLWEREDYEVGDTRYILPPEPIEGLREAIKLGDRVLITMKFPQTNQHKEVKREAIETHTKLLKAAKAYLEISER